MKVNKTLCKKVLSIVDQGLCSGAGEAPVAGKVCVEQAVTMALDEEFSDNPSCVDSDYRAFKIRLNDANWSNNLARAKGMRRLAICQLGTKDTLDKEVFKLEIAKLTISKWLPECLRLTAKNHQEPYKTNLINAAKECEELGTYESAIKAKKAAADAADATYIAATYAAANVAAYATYIAAAYAANAAADAAAFAADVVANAAANVAAYAAYAADAAANATVNDARDKFLSDCAEDVVQLSIKLKTPGSKYLFLTNEERINQRAQNHVKTTISRASRTSHG